MRFEKEEESIEENKNVVNKSGFLISKVYGEKSDEINEKLKSKKLKLACFDMDWTLIKTKNGNTFPKHKDDWLPLFN